MSLLRSQCKKMQKTAFFEYNLCLFEETTPKDHITPSSRNDLFLNRNSDKSVPVQKTVKLNELFTPRRLKLGQTPSAIHRVLLIGEPGCGKTSVAKTVTVQWAKGLLGPEFTAIYLIPIEDIVREAVEDNYSKSPSLEDCIMKCCFPCWSEDDMLPLKEQIKEDLKSETTLIILDGLDEAIHEGKVLFDQAKECESKLLITSRSCAASLVRPYVDIEVECFGLSDRDLYKILGKKISKTETMNLMKSIVQDFALYPIARHPVFSIIIQKMWEKMEIDRTSFPYPNLSNFLETVMKFLWHKYISDLMYLY